MNNKISKYLLVGNKFCLKCIWSNLGLHTVHVDHLWKIKTTYKKTGDSRYTFRNELDKACFQHGMTFGNLAQRTASEKKLCDKTFNIANNPKYDGYQCGLSSMTYNFLTKNRKEVLLLALRQFCCKCSYLDANKKNLKKIL